MINNKGLSILVFIIDEIIKKEFIKISNLSQYLKNIATICSTLNVPISWSLPHGLKINLSYFETYTEIIKIFSFSKSRINLTITVKDKISRNKQIISLTPNLVHSTLLQWHCYTTNFTRVTKKTLCSQYTIVSLLLQIK